MKKTLLIILLFAQGILSAQNLPIKDCTNRACDEKALQELFASAEQALYDHFGFSYNDSIYFELEAKRDSIIFDKSYAWVNEQALYRYQQVIANAIDYSRLSKGHSYSLSWVQKKIYPSEEIPELKEVEQVPFAILAKDFNAKGRKASYQYYCQAYLQNNLREWNFDDDENIEADFVFNQGKLISVNFIYPSLSGKKAFDIAALAKTIEADSIEKASLVEKEAYTFKFKSKSSRTPIISEKRKEFLENQFDFLIDNHLWRPLKTFVSAGRHVDGQLVIIDTSDNPGNYFTGEALEEALKNKKIKRRWWKAIPTLEDIDLSMLTKEINEKSNKLEKVPVYPGCNVSDSNNELKQCFQMNALSHVAENYEYPARARDLRIQGKVNIDFVIEKDGSISSIEVLRALDENADLEAIQVVSKIPNMERAACDGENFVRMPFTLPINLKL